MKIRPLLEEYTEYELEETLKKIEKTVESEMTRVVQAGFARDLKDLIVTKFGRAGVVVYINAHPNRARRHSSGIGAHTLATNLINHPDNDHHMIELVVNGNMLVEFQDPKDVTRGWGENLFYKMVRGWGTFFRRHITFIDKNLDLNKLHSDPSKLAPNPKQPREVAIEGNMVYMDDRFFEIIKHPEKIKELFK